MLVGKCCFSNMNYLVEENCDKGGKDVVEYDRCLIVGLKVGKNIVV